MIPLRYDSHNLRDRRLHRKINIRILINVKPKEIHQLRRFFRNLRDQLTQASTQPQQLKEQDTTAISYRPIIMLMEGRVPSNVFARQTELNSAKVFCSFKGRGCISSSVIRLDFIRLD